MSFRSATSRSHSASVASRRRRGAGGPAIACAARQIASDQRLIIQIETRRVAELVVIGTAIALDADERAEDLDAAPPHDDETTAAQGVSSQPSAAPSTAGAHGAHPPPTPAPSTAGQRSRTGPTPRSTTRQVPARPSSLFSRRARGRMLQAQQLMREQAGAAQQLRLATTEAGSSSSNHFFRRAERSLGLACPRTAVTPTLELCGVAS